MREKTIKVYQFDELSEEAKERVLSKYENSQLWGTDWTKYIFEDWIEEIKEKYNYEIDSKDIDWCVGDRGAGVVLTGKDVMNLIDSKYNKTRTESEDYFDLVDLDLSDLRNWSEIDEDVAIFEDLDEFDINEIESLVIQRRREELKEKIYSWVLELQGHLRTLFKRLDEEYNYLLSEECAIENIRLNEWEFDEEGNSI